MSYFLFNYYMLLLSCNQICSQTCAQADQIDRVGHVPALTSFCVGPVTACQLQMHGFVCRLMPNLCWNGAG